MKNRKQKSKVVQLIEQTWLKRKKNWLEKEKKRNFERNLFLCWECLLRYFFKRKGTTKTFPFSSIFSPSTEKNYYNKEKNLEESITIDCIAFNSIKKGERKCYK